MDGVRRPLVVFTPKSMLRNRSRSCQPAADFTGGRFRPVIDDPRFRETDAPVAGVRTGSSCAAARSTGSSPPRGKRASGGLDDIAIVRIEQLYPVPDRKLAAVLDRYPNAADVRWVQEEPAQPGRLAVLRAGAAGEAAAAGSRIEAGVAAARWPRPPPGRRKVHEVEQATALIAAALDDEQAERADGCTPPIEASRSSLERRGEEQVSVEWLADRLRAFVDRNPAFEDAVERLATFLARDDSLAGDDLDEE